MVRLSVCTVLTLAFAFGAGAWEDTRLPPAWHAAVDPVTVVVVVNDDVLDDSIDAATVRRIFLRRQRFWADGALAAPVNLPATSPVRETFSLSILGRSPREMAGFWNDLYFNGVQPPPVVESQRAVLLYVARTPGAIGYLAADSLPPPTRRDGYRVALTTAR